MTAIDETFRQRWRSRQHVGVAKPEQRAYMRKGYFDRAYRPFHFLDGSTEPDIANFNRGNLKYRGHKPRFPWSNYWTPTSDYMELPALLDFEDHQDFMSKGITTATIQVENVFYEQVVGALGAYTALKRGTLSPWLGYHALGRPRFPWQQVNDWYKMLTGQRQITVHQGYGEDDMPVTFTGLVDDVDMTSNPERITITARDFGGATLTEQRLFGQNKDPALRPPITFADRKHNEEEIPVFRHPRASSHDGSHTAYSLLHGGEWISGAKPNADNTEWIEIHLDNGRYETFFIDPKWGGMEMWISVFAKGHHYRKGHQHVYSPPTKDGVPIDEGWVDGQGFVPGWSDGGKPYIRHYKRVDANGHKGSLGHRFRLGPGSKIRASFRRLHRSQQPIAQGGEAQDFPDAQTATGWRYRAGVTQFVAYKRIVKKEARTNHWILVDDISDVVKVILRWAGFREWDIEMAGVRIKQDKPWVFHQSDFYMDMIDYVASQGNFVFYMAGPTDHDESIGVPTFRYQNAIGKPGKAAKHMLHVRDTDLITSLQIKESAPPKATIIRFRGREAKGNEKGPRIGRLGEDPYRRVNAVYTPRWARHIDEMAAVMRHYTHTDPNMETVEDCMVACTLAAAQMALAAHTGTVEFPGFPVPTLNYQIAILDSGTGTNSRLYITSRGSKFTSGQNASWKTTVGGSLLDTHDLIETEKDFVKAKRAQHKKKKRVEHGSPVDHQAGWGGRESMADLQGLVSGVAVVN